MAVGGGEDVAHQQLRGLRIEMGSRLVEDEHGGVGEQRPREHEAAGAGRPRAARPPRRRACRARRGARRPTRRAGRGERDRELVVGAVRPREQQVRADRRVEEVRLLAGERERAADVFLAQLAEVAAGERDAAALRVEEAQQQVRDGRLAGAARPTSATRRPGSS